MTRDRRGLQNWYRQAMLGRIGELTRLRERLEAGDPGCLDELRKVGQALRGSGGTFGFPELTAVAGLVETTTRAEALRRLEGLVVALRSLAAGDDGPVRSLEWLALCASLPGEAAGELDGADTMEDAWSAVQRRSGLDHRELARRIAGRFGLEVADLDHRSRAAQRLVPEALMASEEIVPLAEDSVTITVASANPVDLETELEIQRLTGRRPRIAVAPPAAIREVLEALGGDRSVSGTRREARPPRSHRPAGGEGPVLVVDDEPSARLLVGSLLEKRGFAAVEAADGLNALQVVRDRDDIELAVVDLNMPRMDGLELIWELREAHRWADLPVIVVTGERDEILEAQIMEEGADDYIRKPIDPRLFLARVEATLRRAAHGSGV